MSATRATTFIPGSADRLAQRDHVRRDVPEVLEDQRQAAEPLAGSVEERHPRALRPRSRCVGSSSSSGSSQNLTRPRKWSIRSRSNSSSSRSSRASHHAKPVGRVRRPVEDRHPPALALRMILRRRRAGDDRAVEELRMRERVARVAGDIERDVADQPDPALVGVLLQREPLALEPRLRAPLVDSPANRTHSSSQAPCGAPSSPSPPS